MESNLSQESERPPMYFYFYLLSTLSVSFILFSPLYTFTVGDQVGYTWFPISFFISTGEVVVISVGLLFISLTTIKAYWHNQVRWMSVVAAVLLLVEYSNVLLNGFRLQGFLVSFLEVEYVRHARTEYALLISAVLALVGAVFPPEEAEIFLLL